MEVKMIVLALAATATLAGNSANASGVGNGGGVHYCPGKPSTEFYDLYEGRVRYDLREKGFKDASVDSIVTTAYLKLAQKNLTLAQQGYAQYQWIQDPAHLKVSEKIKLLPVKDATILMVDEGCSYQQLANWDDATDTIFIKAKYFKPLDKMSLAALYLHESLYKASRSRVNLEGSSDKIRRTVAELLSDSDTITYLEDLTVQDGGGSSGDILPRKDAPEGITFPWRDDEDALFNLGTLPNNASALKPIIIDFSVGLTPESAAKQKANAESVARYREQDQVIRAAWGQCYNRKLPRRTRKEACARASDLLAKLNSEFPKDGPIPMNPLYGAWAQYTDSEYIHWPADKNPVPKVKFSVNPAVCKSSGFSGHNGGYVYAEYDTSIQAAVHFGDAIRTFQATKHSTNGEGWSTSISFTYTPSDQR